MKKLIMILCILANSTLAGFVPKGEKAISIPVGEPMQPYEALWMAVCMVESHNNPRAYNAKEKATGIAQVRPIRLRHYNKVAGANFALSDMYDPAKAKKVFLYFAFNSKNQSLEYIGRAWNGSGYKTILYWRKVKKYL